jgi:parallel beta-helix repeat protein
VPVEDYPNPIPPSPYPGILHKPTLAIYNMVDEAGNIPGAADPRVRAWFAFVSMNPADPFNGNGTLFTMTFQAIKNGISPLEIVDCTLVDKNGFQIAKHMCSQKYGEWLNPPRNGEAIVGYTPCEHDVSVLLETPKHVLLGASVCLNATVTNVGLNDEVNVQLQLLINGNLVNSTTISLLKVNASHVLSYLWTPTVAAYYNITAFALPIPNEGNLMNNAESIKVLVSHCIRVPLDYPTIQEAINIAAEGTTIQVGPGTYYGSIVIDKPLTLIGGGSDTTVIDGEGGGFTVKVTAKNVKILGFTIKNAIVVNCWITETTNITISHNIIKDTPETGAGLCLYESNNNTVLHNTFVNNGHGIYLFNCGGNIIRGNTITNNECGIYVEKASDNKIYHNNFIGNKIQELEMFSVNVWHHNYWDDYAGEDLDGDGIGDTSLPHQGVDHYPLMEPWTPIPGDVNFDDMVNIQDIVKIASSYDSEPGECGWNPIVDIAPPYGKIDILDLVTCTYYYGETYP